MGRDITIDNTPFEVWLAFQLRHLTGKAHRESTAELARWRRFVTLASRYVYTGVRCDLHRPHEPLTSASVFILTTASIGDDHLRFADVHMAVVPVGKVDYSVTKGGVRLWAVVFVFIVLCSSLYSVFHNSELAVGELDGT